MDELREFLLDIEGNLMLALGEAAGLASARQQKVVAVNRLAMGVVLQNLLHRVPISYRVEGGRVILADGSSASPELEEEPHVG